MSPSLLFLLGMFALGFGGPTDKCTPPYPKILLSELDGKMLYLQVYSPKFPFFAMDCVTYKFNFDEKTKTRTMSVAVPWLKFNASVTPISPGQFESTADFLPFIPMKFTFLYADGEGGMVFKQSYNILGVPFEYFGVVASQPVISKDKVSALQKGACITDTSKFGSVNQVGCSYY